MKPAALVERYRMAFARRGRRDRVGRAVTVGVFTPEEIAEAVAATMEGPFPLPDESALVVLSAAVRPVVDDLPDHLRCEVVERALAATFAMGLAVGAEAERRRS